MSQSGQNLLATMITTTTYGTWLPGDLRGYVDEGVILPGDPLRLIGARAAMLGEPVYMTREQQSAAFEGLLADAKEFNYYLIAASIESWHAHWLIDHGFDSVATMVGRLKTRMRQAFSGSRVWTSGYDSRYCFQPKEVSNRKGYIERHAGVRSLPRPHGVWPREMDTTFIRAGEARS